MNKLGNYKHGAYSAYKSEGNSYRSMKERCNNPNYRYYHRYGGRGITICDRWLGKEGFNNFLADMGRKPSPKHTIDRIDNNGNYEPTNCRWATQHQQVTNSSKKLRYITIGGVTKTMSEWCRHFNIPMGSVYNRLKDGWSEERALTIPFNIPGRHI